MDLDVSETPLCCAIPGPAEESLSNGGLSSEGCSPAPGLAHESRVSSVSSEWLDLERQPPFLGVRTRAKAPKPWAPKRKNGAKTPVCPPRRSQESLERRAPSVSQTSRRGQWRSSSFRYESTRESHLRRLLGAALRGAMHGAPCSVLSLGWRESEKPLRAHSLRPVSECTSGGSTRRAALGPGLSRAAQDSFARS